MYRSSAEATAATAAAAAAQKQRQAGAASFLEDLDFNADFSALIPESSSSREGGFVSGGFLNGEDFDFPSVPMEIYGQGMKHGQQQ